jgi:hypothetical protein
MRENTGRRADVRIGRRRGGGVVVPAPAGWCSARPRRRQSASGTDTGAVGVVLRLAFCPRFFDTFTAAEVDACLANQNPQIGKPQSATRQTTASNNSKVRSSILFTMGVMSRHSSNNFRRIHAQGSDGLRASNPRIWRRMWRGRDRGEPNRWQYERWGGWTDRWRRGGRRRRRQQRR